MQSIRKIANKFIRFALLVVFLGGAQPALNAATTTVGLPTPLSDLIAGTALTVGGNEFIEFSYSATGDNPDATRINVIPIVDDEGNYGIRFQGGFTDLPSPGSSDALITYRIVAPTPSIIGTDLFANTSVIGSVDGVAAVTETFTPLFGDILLDVFDNGSTRLTDSVMFESSANYTGPVQVLPVQKNLVLNAGPNGVASTISFVDQIYHQVPEPSSHFTLLVGILLLGVGRRRFVSGR